MSKSKAFSYTAQVKQLSSQCRRFGQISFHWIKTVWYVAVLFWEWHFEHLKRKFNIEPFEIEITAWALAEMNEGPDQEGNKKKAKGYMLLQENGALIGSALWK